MAQFVVCYSTPDNIHANLHAFRRGEGSIRDENHINDIVREFCKGNEDTILASPPTDTDRILFEIVLGVKGTRRNGSNYFGCDYRQIQPCPQCVAEAGMDIFLQLKKLLRRARIRKEKGK